MKKVDLWRKEEKEQPVIYWVLKKDSLPWSWLVRQSASLFIQ
jgi:hypothetical protein